MLREEREGGLEAAVCLRRGLLEAVGSIRTMNRDELLRCFADKSIRHMGRRRKRAGESCYMTCVVWKDETVLSEVFAKGHGLVPIG